MIQPILHIYLMQSPPGTSTSIQSAHGSRPLNHSQTWYSPSVHSLPPEIYRSKCHGLGKKHTSHSLPYRRLDTVIIDPHAVLSQHKQSILSTASLLTPQPLISHQTQINLHLLPAKEPLGSLQVHTYSQAYGFTVQVEGSCN